MYEDRLKGERLLKEIESMHPLKISDKGSIKIINNIIVIKISEKTFSTRIKSLLLSFINKNVEYKQDSIVYNDKILAILPNDKEYLKRVTGKKIVIIVTKTSDDCIVESYDDIDCYNIIIV